MPEIHRAIPIYDNLTYPEFLAKHLIPNTPFLLSSTSTSHWQARQSWSISKSGPSEPNLKALREYGDQIVPVADTFQPEYSEFRRSERPLREVLDLWEREREEGKGLYVKDWHLIAELENRGRGAGEVYEVPECFRDDWLNPPYSFGPRSSPNTTATSTSTSDFRFTYLGPPGTYTPLHRDVYSSHSWSCNIVGRKLWWLFPPNRLDGVLLNGEPVFDVRELDGEGGGIKVVQEEGEVMWVPSGWYHQVLNLDFCISINHNFFSSPTLPRIYAALELSQIRVENSIEDVKDMIQSRLGEGEGWKEEWVGEVQKLLGMDAGWGWVGFWDCVRRNLENPPMALDEEGRRARNECVREIIGRYRTREEWGILDGVREVVESIESALDKESEI